MSGRTSGLVACYYCGNGLSAEKPGRLDECPQCGKYIHACRMCAHYDPAETSKQCAEDDAEKVHDKQAANFCDYFTLSDKAFDADDITAAGSAHAALADLFDDGDSGQTRSTTDQPSQADRLLNDAESLFRK